MEYNSGSNRASNFKIGWERSARPIWNYEHELSFQITSTITLWIVRHEVQLLINRIEADLKLWARVIGWDYEHDYSLDIVRHEVQLLINCVYNKFRN